jgi:N-acetylmuramoyl-L-alanine amidase
VGYLRPWLDKAGRFTVEHIGGIPHFSQPVDVDAPRAGVLHTTEGGWDGSLAVFKQHYAPHFMVGVDKSLGGRVRIAQLVQVGTIGAALVTHNWLALVQVEMIGYSQEKLWFPDDETAEAVAALMAVCKAEYGIPLSRPWADGVYGMARASDPHRNHGEFGHVTGWFGHGDVPAPDSHWDPGALEWSKLFARAAAMPEASAGRTPAPIPPLRCCAASRLARVGQEA